MLKVIPWIRLMAGGQEEISGFCRDLADHGADGLLVEDLSESDEAHEEVISLLRRICRESECPVAVMGRVKRMEDVKKYLYAGCRAVALDLGDPVQAGIWEEVSKRFGREKILALLREGKRGQMEKNLGKELAGGLLVSEDFVSCQGAALAWNLEDPEKEGGFPVFCLSEKESLDALTETAHVLQGHSCQGLCAPFFAKDMQTLERFKDLCEEKGISVQRLQSALPFSDFSTNADGLIPVVVQDYRTDEVLMLAYMNEEAYNLTLKTGRMTYYSRSRQEIWVKGLTSGHFQYVKSLAVDCDRDTLLARVDQIGAACHTGNRTCFYTPLASKEGEEKNPLRVLQNVYEVILDRKAHPKEGSYTNYLFDKGIDKILKKVGEECTEIVIAAKNPDKEEIKYEISDFLYHMMVLMAQKQVTWEDITEELARR